MSCAAYGQTFLTNVVLAAVWKFLNFTQRASYQLLIILYTCIHIVIETVSTLHLVLCKQSKWKLRESEKSKKAKRKRQQRSQWQKTCREKEENLKAIHRGQLLKQKKRKKERIIEQNKNTLFYTKWVRQGWDIERKRERSQPKKSLSTHA